MYELIFNDMNLEKFIKEIDQTDGDLIIFQKDNLSIDSEIALFKGESGESGVITKDGANYFYLLEVHIAKEFVTDWVRDLESKPHDKEIAKRLFEYAINDA
jgi:hypothetical protein